MPPALVTLLRALKHIVAGAIIGGALGYLSYLPALFMAQDDKYAAAGGTIALGVTLVCARAGAVVGLIFFLIRRQLTAHDPVPLP